jgi:hypothetical protein
MFVVVGPPALETRNIALFLEPWTVNAEFGP